MNNNLLNTITPIIYNILKFKLEDNNVEPSDVKNQVLSCVKELKVDVLPFSKLNKYWAEDTQYALVAFLDEIAMNKGFGDKYWSEQTLQLHIFGDHIAGEEFFNRLSKRIQEGPEALPIIKVYYLLLLLGFKGKYVLDTNHNLETLITSVKDFINRYDSPLENKPSKIFKKPEALSPSKLNKIVARFIIGSAIFVALSYCLAAWHLNYSIKEALVAQHREKS